MTVIASDLSRSATHMMSCVFRYLSIGVIATNWSPVVAYAQPICEQVDSIEWMSADSSLVVRGTIVDVVAEEDKENSALWHTVTFAARETLKGKHAPQIKFVVVTNTIDDTIPRWKKERRELVAFLEESRCAIARSGIYGKGRYARFEFAARTGWVQGSLLDLTAGKDSKAYDLTLHQLVPREQIVTRVKEAIGFHDPSGKLCSTWLNVPGHGMLLRLTVPVDARLESAARRWAQSEDSEHRREAALALVSFRSDENEGILKKLLLDPAASIHNFEDSHKGAQSERVYEVREKAYSLLREWGCDVPQPVLREQMDEDLGVGLQRK